MLCSATFWSYELRFFNKHYYFHRRRPPSIDPSFALALAADDFVSLLQYLSTKDKSFREEYLVGELFLLPTAVGFLLVSFHQ